MSNIEFITGNATNFSTYALLDLVYTTFDKDKISIKSNTLLSTTSSDIYAIKKIDSDIEIFLNNIGLLSIQGGSSAHVTEEVIRRNQKGDRVLNDFIDIFNHRTAELMYKIRKNNYLHYYLPNSVHKMVWNYLKFVTINDKYFACTTKINSKYFIEKLIQETISQDFIIRIHKCKPDKVIIQNTTNLGKARLKNVILGRAITINRLTKIEIVCRSMETYIEFSNKKLINELTEILKTYINHFKIMISLAPDQFINAKVGEARLGITIL